MAEVVGDEDRVQFGWTRRGPAPTGDPAARELCEAVKALGAAGLCPRLDDGRLAGNAAVIADQGLWLSPSGRKPDTLLRPEDCVLVDRFDLQTWTAQGRGPEGSPPSSDTPLHWAALADAAQHFGASPRVALHGHALDDQASANRLGAPISTELTRFSTPADRRALVALFAQRPYPACDLWIRRGHGFFLLAETLDGALKRLTDLVGAHQAQNSVPL